MFCPCSLYRQSLRSVSVSDILIPNVWCMTRHLVICSSIRAMWALNNFISLSEYTLNSGCFSGGMSVFRNNLSSYGYWYNFPIISNIERRLSTWLLASFRGVHSVMWYIRYSSRIPLSISAQDYTLGYYSFRYAENCLFCFLPHIRLTDFGKIQCFHVIDWVIPYRNIKPVQFPYILFPLITFISRL